MTLKADDNDLRVEADRTDYPLQVSNKPFAEVHKKKNSIIRDEIGEEGFKQAVELLRYVSHQVWEISTKKLTYLNADAA